MNINVEPMFRVFQTELTRLEGLTEECLKDYANAPRNNPNAAIIDEKYENLNLRIENLSKSFKNYIANFHENLKAKKKEGISEEEEEVFFKENRMCPEKENSLFKLQNHLEAIKHWSNIKFYNSDNSLNDEMLGNLKYFIQAGGKFCQVPFEGDNRAIILESDENIPMCQEGRNRSQTLRGVLESRHGIKVNYVVASGAGIFLFPKGFPINGCYLTPWVEDNNDGYQKCFGMQKMQPVDSDQDVSEWNLSDENYSKLNRDLQEKFFNKLPGNSHFLTFYNPSISALITRIRQAWDAKGHKDLSTCKITYFNWPDQIFYPPENSGIKRDSKESYQALADKISQRIQVELNKEIIN